MTWSAGVAIIAAVLGSAAGPRPALELHVQRGPSAEDCPDAPTLSRTVEDVADIERRMEGGVPPGAPPSVVHADVTFARTTAGYRGTVHLRGAREGERTFTDTGPSCGALAKAVAITMALSLDGEPEPPAMPPPVTPPPAPLIPVSAPRRLRVEVAASAGLAIDTVGAPSLTAGGDVGFGFGRRLAIELGGRHVAARASRLDPGDVRVSLDLALLRVCATVAGADGPLEARACADGAGGALRAAGAGYPTSVTASSAWLAVGAGLDGRWRLGERWRLTGGVDGLLPLRQDTFSVENRGVAFRSSAVSWTTRLGISYQVW